MSNYDKSQRALHGVLSGNEVMVKAKSKLMNSESGLASILLGLPLQEDNSFDTMATDGKVIKYNSDFALGLPMEEIKGVLIHEALHVVWGHHLRRGNRNPKLWNIATDYAINGYIVYKLRKQLPQGGLLSHRYVKKDGSVMSADEIYDILFGDDEALEEAINQMQEQMGDDSDENEGQGQDDSEEDTQGSGDGDGDEESDEDSEGQGSSGSAEDDAGDGEENITSQGLSDERSPQTNQSGKIDLNELPQMAGGIFDMTNEDGSKLSEGETQEQITLLDAQVVMAEKVQGMLVSGGSGVDYLGGRKAELVEQVVPWEDMFRDMFSQVASNNNTWRMPHRRHMARGIHMPSKDIEPSIKNVVMLVDVSGSTSGDRDSFITEAIAIMEEFQVQKLSVNRYAGIALRNQQGEYFDVWDSEQGDEMPEKEEINFSGTGGTNFDAPFNAVEEFLDLDEIDLIVHFSDGEGYFNDDHDELLDTPICHVFSYGKSGNNYGGKGVEELGFGEVIYMS